jgi:hypothetical protein
MGPMQRLKTEKKLLIVPFIINKIGCNRHECLLEWAGLAVQGK